MGGGGLLALGLLGAVAGLIGALRGAKTGAQAGSFYGHQGSQIGALIGGYLGFSLGVSYLNSFIHTLGAIVETGINVAVGVAKAGLHLGNTALRLMADAGIPLFGGRGPISGKRHVASRETVQQFEETQDKSDDERIEEELERIEEVADKADKSDYDYEHFLEILKVKHEEGKIHIIHNPFLREYYEWSGTRGISNVFGYIYIIDTGPNMDETLMHEAWHINTLETRGVIAFRFETDVDGGAGVHSPPYDFSNAYRIDRTLVEGGTYNQFYK